MLFNIKTRLVCYWHYPKLPEIVKKYGNSEAFVPKTKLSPVKFETHHRVCASLRIILTPRYACFFFLLFLSLYFFRTTMSERSPSPANDIHRRSLSRSPLRRGRSYTPRSRSSSSRSYSRSRSRSRSYSRHRRSPSRSRSPYRSSSSRSYHRRYYSRSPPPSHHRRSPPPSRRYRSRSPPPRRRIVNKDCRVYVGNLPFEVTWHQLKDFMREGK